MGLYHFILNVLLRICSKTLYFDLASNRLVTSYVGRSLMHPLTPPPRSLTPSSFFLAAEAFEDVPTGMAASEDVPQGHGRSVFFY